MEIVMKQNSVCVLGAYGTKAKGFGTTSILVDKSNVIDAGNLLDTLEERSASIENIFLTHSHLDHIADIAYILDNYFLLRKKPLNIIGLPHTLKTLQTCYLNDILWPDFSKIALDNGMMAVTYETLQLQKNYITDRVTSLKAFATDHTVPSCGYIVKKDGKGVLITADTYSLAGVIDEVFQDNTISTLVVECSFPSSMERLAKESKHLTPKLLFEQLKPLQKKGLNLYINHIKPLYLEEIIKEIESLKGVWNPIILQDNDEIVF